MRKLYSFAALAVVVASLYYYQCTIETPKEEIVELSESAQDTIPAYVPTYYYGIVVDSLSIEEGKIRRNQNLADILKGFNVSDETIYQTAINSRKVFDVRKFVSRKAYSVLYTGDSVKQATHFIYRPTPIDYVVYDFQDSVEVYKGSREVDIVEKEIAGDIQISLYVDMLEGGGSVELVNELVEVFAWQVDFFGIRKGDNYKIIYDEHYVDGQFVGIGEIKAAYFQHIGEEFYAVQFDQGEGLDYFDPNGESLRSEFLKAPLTFTRISSRYSGRRFHPVQKRYKAHLGTDYAAPRGTPIFAAADGIITDARYKSNNGNFVKIKHNGNIATQYLHMSKIAKGIRRGEKVKRGQTIGFVGSTGLATGPHLCYRFWKNGRQVDALKVKLPPSNPILEENQWDFDSLQAVFTHRLDMIQLQEFSEEEVFAKVN